MPVPDPVDRGNLTEPAFNRYAFILHPLSVDFVARHPRYQWTHLLPHSWVESAAAHLPAQFVGRARGGRSAATGQQIDGLIYALGSTPQQMLSHAPEFTYKRIERAIRDAADRGARIAGLGAFTKVVGDAGVTIAQRAPIPVTTGNSLTIAATLETAKIAVRRMGWSDLSQGRVMVVGATGAIGSVCARLLAAAVRDIVLVSRQWEKLVALRSRILSETPGARVEICTDSASFIAECDLIITATSAFGQRVLDVSQCKPGAVILDVALPSDIAREEAAVRPDVLVIESGEVVIPGPIEFTFDIGLPPGVAYACLAEAALLAMAGRFESFTLGRNVQPEQVKEMYRLFRLHGCAIAPLRSFGRLLTDELIAEKNDRAAELRRNPELFARVKAAAARSMARIPPRAKGVSGGATAWQPAASL